MTDFTRLPDLALRTYGGAVVAANDESFAEREALIRPGPPAFQPHTFGAKGQLYDGWETRRRREPGHDWAIVRLGLPGVIRGIVIDTAWFKGNYPPHASVEACAADGWPAPGDLAERTDWVEIVPPGALKGDAAHQFEVADPRRFTHVRLNIFPDGGVARLRVHGEVVPDPVFLTGLTVDLAALENGGLVIACSDEFYSSPNNVIAPGRPRNQAEGWETARRRDGGNDWLIVALAGAGTVAVAELDTANLVFNAPGWASVSGIDAGQAALDDPGAWFPLLPRTRLQPDTRHRFRLDSDRRMTHARLDIYPDGGLGRLRLLGTLAP
ncbi:allantoicase [Planotetraspora phitsanulokensis]|uniref:Probable allantoicase n=1 Tax=Planotetraspora phitsanulokensis TaxID=575192 RepID=A0A8J3TYB1_9ACTN|nr:allantoicase [Planotetraspora phitsanulokensis]GII35303.1 putative allantoicase [Planotetraspora phitsanulokensis]